MSIIIEILISAILFLAASYLIFYKKFLTALGKETAKLITVEEYTRLQEDVKSSFAQQLEVLKAELNRKGVEYQIQFSLLHSKRADAIVGIHKKMVVLARVLDQYTNPFIPGATEMAVQEEKTRRFNEMCKAYSEFDGLYATQKIWFKKEFCIQIDRFVSLVTNICKKNDLYLSLVDKPSYDYHDAGKMDQIFNNMCDAMTDFRNATIMLEDEFRGILYVNDKSE